MVSSSERKYWMAVIADTPEDDRHSLWAEMVSHLGTKDTSELWMSYFSATDGGAQT